MSCQVKLVANLADIPKIRRILFPTDDDRGSDIWLQSCLISVCPTGETITIAKEKRIVILSAEWDSDSCTNVFQITYSGCLDNDDPIRAVLCLPLVKDSSEVGPDWTCIAVGFESGLVRFYTKDCKLLFSEQFHSESVCSIKCQSQFSPRSDINYYDGRLEEVFVHYPSNICKISGNRLFGVLRFCYSQLCEGFGGESGATFNETNFKKWGYEEQFAINDSAVVGLTLINSFDHLLTASTCGGFDAKYKITPPIRYSVVAAGSKPCIGFHFAAEYINQPVLSDVAKAVASKLKSALLPGWLTGKQATVEKPTLAQQASQSMNCRFGICDLRRTASTIILSQNRRLALVNDLLGRVFLLDSHRGIVLHMFKGYRDAQCAFIQTAEDQRSRHIEYKRVATFVVIYSPKKGTIEIFCAQKCFKIATFSASKFSTLLYISYGLVGVKSSSATKYLCPYNCILMDSDGQIKSFDIPFHFALPETDSKKARDIFLYKRSKHFIKTTTLPLEEVTEEIMKFCLEIESADIQIECLKMLAKQPEIHPATILRCTESVLERYKLPEGTLEDAKSKITYLQNLATSLNKLARVYSFLKSPTRQKTEVLSFRLNFEKEILENLQNFIKLSLMKNEDIKSVSFNNNLFKFCEFLSAFEHSSPSQISLKQGLDASNLHLLSTLFFNSYLFEKRADFHEFSDCISKNSINVKDLFELLLMCWLKQSVVNFLHLEDHMNILAQLVDCLLKLDESFDLVVDYNETSLFWSDIRDILTDSPKPFLALSATLVCRNMAAKHQEGEAEQHEADSNIDEESFEIWEKLSQEKCNWYYLIGKLDDVTLLSIILSSQFNPPKSKYCDLPRLKHKTVEFSLRYILDSGKGSVSDMIAKWLTTAGINPKSLILNERIEERKDTSDDSVNLNDSDEDDFSALTFGMSAEDYKEIEVIFTHFNMLKKHFRFSLHSDIILTYMCWEYSLAWKNQINEFSYLEASLDCANQINRHHLKEGILYFIWNTHLKILFESVCKLINKTGKLPTQALCKQDTDYTDVQIGAFLKHCTAFLESLLDAVDKSNQNKVEPLEFDDIIRKGSESLAELVLKKGGLYYALVHTHFQLSRSLELLIKFPTKKFPKPIDNLFDHHVSVLFFVDFHHIAPLRLLNPDEKTQKSRLKFLTKVIKSSVSAISGPDDKNAIQEHLYWTEQCVKLAKIWQMEIGFFKRVQVLELYIKGCDTEANDLLQFCVELHKSGTDFLNIAAKRLHLLILSSSNPTGNQTCLSCLLSNYIKTRLAGDWCAPGPLSSVKKLTTYALRAFNENPTTGEYKLAQHLQEACETFEQMEGSEAQPVTQR